MGPFQMVGHVVQNRHDGTQEMFVSIVSSVTVRFLRSSMVVCATWPTIWKLPFERRSRYVTLPWWQSFCMITNWKRHLKSEFALFQTSWILFNFIFKFVKCCLNFLGLNPKGLHLQYCVKEMRANFTNCEPSFQTKIRRNFGASIGLVPAKFRKLGDEPKGKFAAWTRKVHAISRPSRNFGSFKWYFCSTKRNFVWAKRNFVIEKFLADQGAVV